MYEVVIAGIGQTPVGEHWEKSLRELADVAIVAAMEDAPGLKPEALYVANMLSSSISYQSHLGSLMSQRPITRLLPILTLACVAGTIAFVHAAPPTEKPPTARAKAVTYADDIAVFTASERSAERVLESVTRWIEKHLKVEVNREKSGRGPTDQTSLLGFRCYTDGQLGISPKATKRLKENVRRLWDARQSLTSKQLRDQWQRYITGWWNYFGLADRLREVNDLTGWIRRHIRKCFWLRWKTPRGRRNALRRLGVKGRALGNCYSGRGAWRMATHWTLHQALSNRQLHRYGFTIPWDLRAAGN